MCFDLYGYYFLFSQQPFMLLDNYSHSTNLSAVPASQPGAFNFKSWTLSTLPHCLKAFSLLLHYQLKCQPLCLFGLDQLARIFHHFPSEVHTALCTYLSEHFLLYSHCFHCNCLFLIDAELLKGSNTDLFFSRLGLSQHPAVFWV